MHLRITPGMLPETVLLPGDPGRVPLIGKCWETYEEVQWNREFRSARGTFRGVPLGACSTGIGGPSTEIAVVELVNAGARTFIRVGTCAALQDYIRPGDLVIHTGAVRASGAADAYVPRGYPAVAHYEVVAALVEAAEQMGCRYHVGVTASVDSFYAGEVNPLPNNLWLSHMDDIIPDLSEAGVLNFEMEASTLFVVAGLLSARAGCVCVVAANRITGERDESAEGIRTVSQVASQAGYLLNLMDRAKGCAGKNWWFPSLWRGDTA